MTQWLADVISPPQVCNGTIWDHIDHWEVVLTAIAMVACWAAVNIARMHFMVKISERNIGDTHSPEVKKEEGLE